MNNPTKEEVQQALKDGKGVEVAYWVFYGYPKIYGTCGEPNCCEWDFDNFEQFWEAMLGYYNKPKRYKFLINE